MLLGAPYWFFPVQMCVKPGQRRLPVLLLNEIVLTRSSEDVSHYNFRSDFILFFSSNASNFFFLVAQDPDWSGQRHCVSKRPHRAEVQGQGLGRQGETDSTNSSTNIKKNVGELIFDTWFFHADNPFLYLFARYQCHFCFSFASGKNSIPQKLNTPLKQN